jgi:hypothetical protein
VFFTETHLNKQTTDDDIAMSGFDVPFRKDRNSHGGGIIMYHKSNINTLRRVYLEHEHVESMWFESVFSKRYIKTTDSNIIIGCLII